MMSFQNEEKKGISNSSVFFQNQSCQPVYQSNHQFRGFNIGSEVDQFKGVNRIRIVIDNSLIQFF